MGMFCFYCLIKPIQKVAGKRVGVSDALVDTSVYCFVGEHVLARLSLAWLSGTSFIPILVFLFTGVIAGSLTICKCKLCIARFLVLEVGGSDIFGLL